jgi:iron(III) transport system substrate-binding protein
MNMRSTIVSGFIALCALCSGTALGQPASDKEVEELIRAAKAEGEVVAYASQPQPINLRFAQAFTAKYGIKISFLRLSSGPLVQRYASEAAAGNVAADILFFPINGSETFLTEAKKQGWLRPLLEAHIPALTRGQYPAKFIRPTPAFPTPIVGIIPWAFGYNTQRIAAKEAPKTWSDVLDPKWKGQIIRTDPKLSLGQMDPWRLLLDRYGEAYFEKLHAQDPRTSTPEAVAAAQALAAGEGSILIMTTGAVIQAVKDKGAPVAAVTPSLTTGVEMGIFMSSKAKHPNAARLAIHYALSPDGTNVQNADPGSVDPYDVSKLPSEYESPKSDTPTFYEQINKLLSR